MMKERKINDSSHLKHYLDEDLIINDMIYGNLDTSFPTRHLITMGIITLS